MNIIDFAVDDHAQHDQQFHLPGVNILL